jgi:hypothetical protein
MGSRSALSCYETTELPRIPKTGDETVNIYSTVPLSTDYLAANFLSV